MAFGKLHGVLASKPLSLPAKNKINMGLLGGNVLAGTILMATGNPTLALTALSATGIMGGAMGAHLTASIGGADMPVSSANYCCRARMCRARMCLLACYAATDQHTMLHACELVSIIPSLLLRLPTFSS